jgi:hypothetical protein
MDPECKEIFDNEPKPRIGAIFPCAWRPEKFCKGVCEVMEVTQRDIKCSLARLEGNTGPEAARKEELARRPKFKIRKKRDLEGVI